MTPKSFRQRRPDGAGGWVWKMTGVKLVPYHLPEIQKADTIFICEGEKDADNLIRLGLTATCNPMGAGKWRETYNGHFQGKQVVILPDNDDPGRKHAQDVARNLHGVAGSVKIVELPGLPEKGDVSDWLATEGTREALEKLVGATPEWKPGPEDEPAQDEKEQKPAQQDILLSIAATAELFHTPDDECYAQIPVNGHYEVWAIKSRGFKRWLSHEFYKTQRKGPQNDALSSALQVLEARGQFDAPERPVWVRVAEHEGKIYIDLANAAWEAIEISSHGWQVVRNPPVCFKRSRAMLPLPYPEKGGSVNDLRPFLNIASDSDFWLMVAYLLAAMRPRGPFPVMVENGEQGAAKTTTARVIIFLIDPSTSPLRSSPREVRDLMIAASNSWVMGYDNLSGVPDWISDALCRLSTGGGFSTRELYTNQEEIIFEATRPIVLNGIEALATRQDLADRSLIFNLPQIPDNARRPEREFWVDFEEARPRILGALLDAVSMGLRNQGRVTLPALPRMADFALWIAACEPA
ncbi:MAG: hypothetical protein HY743_07980, partial [Deltaproteobacteria bacterium]|nr:hypothetical protein [Deltaproteobacteria bacterium]